MMSLLPTVADVPSSAYERADAVARQLVGQAFLVPLLKEVRESTCAQGMFAPGAAEKRFGPIVDHQMADALMTRLDLDVVTNVRQYMLNKETHKTEVNS